MKQGWTYKKLGEVAKVQNGFAFDSKLFNEKSLGTQLIRIRDIKRAYSMTYTTEKCSDDYVIEDGNVLIGMDGDFNVCMWSGGHAYLNQRVCCVIPSDEISSRFIYYLLPFPLKRINDKTAFSTVKHLSSKQVNEILIPIPPISEQLHIVNRLDSAFAHIDALKANAEKQLADARALFQKALTKAMEPKEGWEEKKLGDLVYYFSGYAFESKGYTKNDDDVLLICGDNIVHCDFRWETIKHWPKEEYEDLKRFSLEENDIVLAMDRPWVKSGLKIAKISPKELPSLLIQRTACIRATKDISSDFIFYSLQTDKYIKHLVSQQTGVGVPHISGKQILGYIISIPKYIEQQRIVSRLDSLSAHVRELEEVTQKTIAECDALKQALLRKVFE